MPTLDLYSLAIGMLLGVKLTLGVLGARWIYRWCFRRRRLLPLSLGPLEPPVRPRLYFPTGRPCNAHTGARFEEERT